MLKISEIIVFCNAFHEKHILNNNRPPTKVYQNSFRPPFNSLRIISIFAASNDLKYFFLFRKLGAEVGVVLGHGLGAIHGFIGVGQIAHKYTGFDLEDPLKLRVADVPKRCNME